MSHFLRANWKNVSQTKKYNKCKCGTFTASDKTPFQVSKTKFGNFYKDNKRKQVESEKK